MFNKKNLKLAFKTSVPLIIGFIPVAFICGVILQGAGLSPFQVFLMSSMVFAGSSQMVAASMISSGAGVFPIVFTAFVINIRNMLYSSSLSQHIKTKSVPKLLIMSHFIGDEIYAISNELYQEGNWNDDVNLLFSTMGFFYWVLGCTMGGIMGDVANIPVDIAAFSLIAMFILFAYFQCNSRIKFIVCMLSIVVSTVIINFYKGSFNVIIASLICATVGYLLDRKEEKSYD